MMEAKTTLTKEDQTTLITQYLRLRKIYARCGYLNSPQLDHDLNEVLDGFRDLLNRQGVFPLDGGT